MRAALGENISAPRSTFFARFHFIVAPANAPESLHGMEIEISLH